MWLLLPLLPPSSPSSSSSLLPTSPTQCTPLASSFPYYFLSSCSDSKAIRTHREEFQEGVFTQLGP